MTRFFKGPVSSIKNIKAIKKAIDSLFGSTMGSRTEQDYNINGGQSFIYFNPTEIENVCTKMDCEGCDCTTTPTPTPTLTPTLTPTPSPTGYPPTPTPTKTTTPTPSPTGIPPSPSPTPSSSYNFGPLGFTANGFVP